MKTFNYRTNTHLLIYILLIGALALASACSFEIPAGTKSVSAERTENRATTPQNGGASNSANESTSEKRAETDAAQIEGTFRFNNHRTGSDGYENSLIVEKAENGKMRVSFEGTFFYQANGAETFHESSAYGTLTVDGSVAKGELTEEGSDNGCRIELNFASDERVSLKSANCDLNVTPDGVYKKGAASTDNLDADVVEKNRRQDSDNDPNHPFVEYDQSGEANGIVNLMERDGERVGCEEDVMNYTGEVKKVDYVGDYVYEFTLESDNRRPQRISLALSSEDRLPFDDVRSIIRRGNHLEVTFISCGNAGIATPTAIYKR